MITEEKYAHRRFFFHQNDPDLGTALRDETAETIGVPQAGVTSPECVATPYLGTGP
jgi:hypothetical protein